jgi:Rad3-related DNA helicase
MSVSMSTRKYVKESIEKAMPYREKEVDEIQVEYEAMEEEINDYVKKRMAEFFKKHKGNVIAFCSDYEYNQFTKVKKELVDNIYIHTPEIRTKLYDEICEENKRIATARKKIFDELLVNFELGGTKEDLDRMIAELSKGE